MTPIYENGEHIGFRFMEEPARKAPNAPKKKKDNRTDQEILDYLHRLADFGLDLEKRLKDMEDVENIPRQLLLPGHLVPGTRSPAISAWFKKHSAEKPSAKKRGCDHVVAGGASMEVPSAYRW